jgi:hypothetical protein
MDINGGNRSLMPYLDRILILHAPPNQAIRINFAISSCITLAMPMMGLVGRAFTSTIHHRSRVLRFLPNLSAGQSI